MMRNNFLDDLDFLRQVAKLLTGEDLIRFNKIIDDLEVLSTVNDIKRINTTVAQAKKRKYDKLYGRSAKEIQNTFYKQSTKIKKLLENTDNDKAIQLYKDMQKLLKLPKYEVIYKDVVSNVLTEDEIKWLNKKIK